MESDIKISRNLSDVIEFYLSTQVIFSVLRSFLEQLKGRARAGSQLISKFWFGVELMPKVTWKSKNDHIKTRIQK